MLLEAQQAKQAEKGLDRTKQVESCYNYIRDKISEIQDLCLGDMSYDALVRYQKTWGSTVKHHNFAGGLVVHTGEVLEFALKIAESKSLMDINRDYLITAIVYHDIGKIFDYVPKQDGTVEYGDHKKEIGHLARSYAEFMIDADKNKVPEKIKNKIGNIILSHHGLKEFLWGSAADPVYPESFIIHYADMLSARCSKDFYIRS